MATFSEGGLALNGISVVLMKPYSPVHKKHSYSSPDKIAF